MYDKELVCDILYQILEATQKVSQRFKKIKTVSDFTDSPAGMEKLDSICMLLNFFRAVLILNNYHDPKVTEALIGKLKDDNENVWISAANVLKNRKDPRIVDSLILTISDNRDEIRWHSVII